MSDERAQQAGFEPSTAMRLAASASLGAGAIHAAAIGVHSEHHAAVVAFVLVAAFQIGWAFAASHSASRALAAVGVAGNLACIAGWLLAKTIGISFIAGLDQRERVQFADGLAAALAAVSVLACLTVIVQPATLARHRKLIAAMPALLIAAVTIPAMASAGSHVHSGTETAHDHGTVIATAGGTVISSANADSTGAVHDHTDATTAVTAHDHAEGAAAPDTLASHDHESAGAASDTVAPATPGSAATPTPSGVTVAVTQAAHQHTPDPTLPASSNWPRPWDPSKPLDLSGVAGVNADQLQRATALVEGTLADLPKYADPKAAIADGYASIGDAGTGTEHYIKSSLVEDGDMLDPQAPESLVYDVVGNQRILAGAMYIASTRPITDPSLTDFAGPLMQWHIHDNLCWGQNAAGKAVVVGIVDANGNCARGVRAGGGNPMVHVWIVARPCGVFSALEGIGAGSAAVPDSQRVDKCTTH